MKRNAVIFLILAAAMLAPQPASSQSIWLPRDVDRSVTVEFLQPDFDEGLTTGGEDFMTAAVFLSTRLPLSPKLAFIGQIPFARYHNSDFVDTDKALGNVYIGLEERGAKSLFAEFGVYLPTSSANAPSALATGLFSDVARWDAYYDHAVTVQAALNLRRVARSHFMVGVRMGPALVIPTEFGDGKEIYGNYSGRFGYEGKLVRAGAGFTGRVILTAGRLFGSQAVNQAEVHVDIGRGTIRPGLELKIPVGILSQHVSTVVGASLTLVL